MAVNKRTKSQEKIYAPKKDNKKNTLVIPTDMVYFRFDKDTKHHKAGDKELVHELVAQNWLAQSKGEILGKKADVEEKDAIADDLD